MSTEEITKKANELSLEKTALTSAEELAVKHPLNSKWTLWYTKPPVDKSESWSDLLRPVITFDTVEEFWAIYNSIPKASELPVKSDYHLFKEGIKPEWEDELNSKGGKWSFQFKKPDDINDLWTRSLLSVIGETIEEDDSDEVNGIVLNIRKGFIRIGLWTRTCDENTLLPIGEKLKKVLKLTDDMKLEFASHQASNIRGSKPLLTV
ncbi:hypothetical protein PACTADRAFT_51766 [Pachysolen tannophilus NRRL Y-2460]|uniref:Eukaryotic translation initiation factor 4E n=1 Tax=Pachysolen tannophilus NRRL Y-2460 TaxID=669874 RepID=A0A1E4TN04_PACTA|nr:hypothetical protein PACTADRAFT_51766 [Pachysolen tannophilus NRRL Y-2460]